MAFKRSAVRSRLAPPKHTRAGPEAAGPLSFPGAAGVASRAKARALASPAIDSALGPLIWINTKAGFVR